MVALLGQKITKAAVTTAAAVEVAIDTAAFMRSLNIMDAKEAGKAAMRFMIDQVDRILI
jgi:hypothetical protein